MLIFWEQRLVFLATPKAGSSAVEAALEPLASVVMQRPAELKHMSAVDFYRHIGPCLSERAGAEFTTVALMREPIEWLRSWYRFRQRDDYDDPQHPMSGLSFDAFARDYISAVQPAHAAVGTQSEILTDSTGKLLVDRVFRYEAIDQFVQFLEDRLDCAITLPRVNVPPAVDVKLSPATEAALRVAMTRDIDLYRVIG
ncbi:sulfotransferase family protein [Sedimentimonas flavescens]|uniref:sulfotransferase family protein n=1 Tax=Sedimentimonas flavescens TaxID=2851012 RepID=UPI0021A27435|nr:sulfotransferase family protein [Sedimentimonas flavescens]MCT2538492.1 sulfotransferase family protein [Sedimentimonas flavescens]